MDIFIAVFLPLTLVVIMFSLGVGLRFDDFRRVALQPKAFAVGALTQIFIIPLVAYLIAIVFQLSPEMALGLMILSFCPSGVTSNFLTKVGNGDVALAVSLTGVSTLMAVVTMPIFVAIAAQYFLGETAPDIKVTALALRVFLITAIPVIAGILLRRYAEAIAVGLDKPLYNLATVLFIVVVLGALASNWTLFIENLPKLGPSVVSLNVLLLTVGLGVAWLFALSGREATTISIETGIHNATLGITVGALIAMNPAELPPYSVPAGLYGITMYLVSIPFVFWRRRLGAADAHSAAA